MLLFHFVSALKNHISASYRRLLLFFGFSLAFLTFFINLSSFFLVFTQVDNLLEQTRGYEYIYGLTTVLKQSRGELNAAVHSDDFMEKKLSISTAAPRVNDLLKKILGEITVDDSVRFLARGIENGITYIGQQYESMNAQTDETVKFGEAYNTLNVYQYIINYADDKMLSGFSAIHVAHIADVMNRMKLYRALILSAIFAASLFFALMSLKITRKLISPIQDMVLAAQEISGGNLDIPDLSLNAAEEMRLLEQTLNVMKENLKRDIKNREDRAALAAELDAARMSALQAQIHPHFLFNALNIINRTAIQENAEKTQDLIQSLSGIFRFNLEYRKTVLLKKELDFIAQYMHVQKSRFPDRIDYSCECACDISGIVVPPFIVQPFVENAVIHGIEQSENGGIIKLLITRTDSHLLITVADTGVGMSDERLKSILKHCEEGDGSHIGIQNVLNRVKLFYRGKAGVTITHNQPCGISVAVLLPLEEEE